MDRFEFPLSADIVAEVVGEPGNGLLLASC
jgi:hypothetical protein